MSLPEGVNSPIDVIPDEISHRLWLQYCFDEAEYLIGCMDSCVSSGDPHIYTYDGLVYHDQSIGEFVLSREAGGSGFEVQARQGRLSGWSPCVTLNTAVAMQLDTNVVEYRAGSNEILVDGSVITLSEGDDYILIDGVIVTRKSGIRVINASTGVSVRAKDRGPYINIIVTAPCSKQGTLESLCGNFDGDITDDLQLRDGTQTSNTSVLMDDWRIDDTESLFTYASGQNTATFTDVQTCGIRLTPADIEAARQIYEDEFGAEACDQAMIIAIATDLAAGMPLEEVIEWVRSIKGYVAPAGTLWFTDADTDGFGNADISVQACTQPSGYVDNSLDCDDSNSEINPAASGMLGNSVEYCGGECGGFCKNTSIETIIIPVNGSTVTSTSVLASGITYTIIASGTFYIGGGNLSADAEYVISGTPYSGNSNVDHGIGINDTLIDTNRVPFWGEYESSHIYTIEFTGLGSTINLNYHDDYYGDNSGRLTVEILQPLLP